MLEGMRRKNGEKKFTGGNEETDETGYSNPVKFAGLTRHTSPVFQTNRRRLTLPQADA